MTVNSTLNDKELYEIKEKLAEILYYYIPQEESTYDSKGERYNKVNEAVNKMLPTFQSLLKQAELRGKSEENLWWINYCERAIIGKDSDATTTKIFKVRVKKHRERLAELEAEMGEK